MTRQVKIASVQLPAVPGGVTNLEKKESNFLAAERMLNEAGEMGADVASLGEIFNVHGCQITEENFAELTSGDPEMVLSRLGGIARKYSMYIIAPVYGGRFQVPSAKSAA